MFTQILATLVALSSVSKQADDGHAADRTAIRSHIESIFNAYIHKDTDTLAKTHSQDWRGFGLSSTNIQHGLEGYMRNAPGGFTMSAFKINEIDIYFPVPTVGIVNYVSDVEFGSAKTKYRVMDIYEKRDGGWIQTATNTALHPDAITSRLTDPRTVSEPAHQALLKARDAVWNAWFTGDKVALSKLLSEDVIAVEGTDRWEDQKTVVDASEQFVKGGSKLISLTFPKDKVQAYGNLFTVYSDFKMDLQLGDKKVSRKGTCSETFLLKNGTFICTGWHLAQVEGSVA